MHQPAGWLERRYGRDLLIRADRGVVIAAGGFGASRELLRAHAPSARGGLPLATPGDDGSGLLLGTGAGGAAALLDRVSVWRFLSPPPALLRGVLVDADGKRICDESRYGAAIGDEIIRRGGRAWLFADQATITAARRQLRDSTLWFQRLQARYLLTFGRVTADTVAGVAARAGVDPGGLEATVAAYNAVASSAGSADAGSLDAGSADPGPLDAGRPDTGPSGTTAAAPDPAGKPADLLISQDQPPYSLIDFSIRRRLLNPAPVLTLGGLVVDHGTGQVVRADGTAVPGLYAAGRSAVGLCSRSYVSGLSIADCVFSGRRAGRHASTASPVTPSCPGADEDAPGA